VLPVEKASALASVDGEFRIAARFWAATIRFVAGREAVLVDIKDGSATARADDPAATVALTISAPTETWRKMLVQSPRPFYHDVLAASRSHDVLFQPASLEAGTSYYPAIRRFIELMRSAGG
jgi:hypothetical protein